MLENLKSSCLNLTKLRGLTLSAMFLALYVILGFFKIPITPENRISFTFLSLSVSGFVLGPIPAALVGALGDIIGFALAPTGTFFPGLTLSAALAGFIYGLCLYKKPFGHIFLWILLACTTITLIINIGLNTLWVSMLFKKAIKVLFWGRLIKNVIALPIEIAAVFTFVLFIEKTGLKKKYD